MTMIVVFVSVAVVCVIVVSIVRVVNFLAFVVGVGVGIVVSRAIAFAIVAGLQTYCRQLVGAP